MKPVKKGIVRREFTAYGQAKAILLERLGQHCSYCEAYGRPQDLDVEHIYPKQPHPELELKWKNFLVSCSTCNTYKHHHLGSVRQTRLEARFLWPHRENTFRAFEYFADGRVEVRQGLKKSTEQAAEATREMVGLLRSPAKAKEFEDRGIPYDGATNRNQSWREAESLRSAYLKNPSPVLAGQFADIAVRLGHFSIWMAVFHDRPEMLRELIRAFKANPDCFNVHGLPIKNGRV
jgi:uncharacterized protein (TIGR02646 family)